jgi:hypothetical protein
VILQSLHWRAFGPILRPEGLREEAASDPGPAVAPDAGPALAVGSP